MDIDRFLITDDNQRQALQELACQLCHKIPVEAVTCLSSRHYFCKECIERHLRTSSTCPVDDESLLPGQQRPCRFHHTMLAMFKVRCGNRRRTIATSNSTHRGTRCDWVGAMPDLTQHQSECHFRSISCPACGRSVLANYFDAHAQHCPHGSAKCELCQAVMPNERLSAHYDKCPSASVYCPNHCVVQSGSSDALVLRRCDVRAHLKVCPNLVLCCQFAAMGCPFRGNKKEMKVHDERCTRDHLSLIAKSYSRLVQQLKRLGAPISVLGQEEKEHADDITDNQGATNIRPSLNQPAVLPDYSLKSTESAPDDSSILDKPSSTLDADETNFASSKRRRSGSRT